MTETTEAKDTFDEGIMGAKIMLLGDAGTGKTHSMHTLVDAGYEVFAILTENCMDVLADIPASQLHWRYINPSSADWSAFADAGKKINTMPYKQLAELPHVNRGKHKEWLNVVDTLDNFVCQRTGEVFGSTQDWNTKRVLWIDSFDGFSEMAMNLIAGAKPIRHPGDYGVSMDTIYNIFRKLCSDLSCHVVFVGHLAREKNEVTHSEVITISTLGNKLGPKLPSLCTDVIHAVRNGSDFFWSTTTNNMTLKARNIPWDNKMPPSFAPLMKNWESRNQMAIDNAGK